MKAHELGKKLLEGPDHDVVVPAELSANYILRLSDPFPGTVVSPDSDEDEPVIFLIGDEDDVETI